ncbi:hypothetical protein [Hydrogenimonas sp.]
MAHERVYICTGDAKEVRAFEHERFVEASWKRAKKGFCAAMVPVGAIRSHSFKIPLNTSAEKLETIVEITMFEEGGLDIDKEYAIAFVKHPLDFESSWLVESFAVEQAELVSRFGDAASKTGHIDLLAIPYLAYEALYAYGKADDKAVELFLYLGEEVSYAALYKGGRYLTHRSLPSLASLALKAGVSVEALSEALRERGLDKGKYAPDEGLLYATIEEALGGMVERIAHTISHKRGIFGIGSVDTLLIDFGQAEIPGLWELFDGYGFEESRKGALACCEGLAPGDQHAGVEALYLLAAAQEKLEAPNLTIFEKRPGFLQTHTGRFLTAVAASALLVGGYGLLTVSELDALGKQRAALQSQLQTVRQKARALTAKLKAERELRDETAEALNRRRLELMAFDEAADTMMLIKASARKRQKMLKDVDEALKAYALSATSMEQNGSRRMAVEILTGYGSRDRIAKFMKRLVDEGYGSVGTREIKLDENVYQSRVEIVR